MAKQKKKRNKLYRGADASVTRPTITRIQAANRRGLSQWWFEKKRVVRPLIITVLVILAVIIVLIELIRIIGGSGA